jgi:hypothetical protein
MRMKRKDAQRCSVRLWCTLKTLCVVGTSKVETILEVRMKRTGKNSKEY